MRGNRMSNEKANNFSLAMKKIFASMNSFRNLMVVAIFFAMISSILALVSPNKISNITDAITEGITPNEDNIALIMKTISSNFESEDNIKNILYSDKLTDEEKYTLMNIFNDKNLTKEEIQVKMFSLPEHILVMFFKPFEVDGVTISSEDQLKTMKLFSSNANIMESFNKLPQSIIKVIEPKMDMNFIKSMSLFLLILYIISALVGYLQGFILATVSNKYAKKLRTDISTKINRLPLKYFDNHEMGDILSRVTNDIDAIGHNLNNSLATLVQSITLFIGSLIMMFYTNWIMAITAIIASLIGFSLMGTILSKSQKYFIKKQRELGELNSHIEEIYSGHTIVKAYNGEKTAKKEFERLNGNLYDSNLKSQFLSGLMPALMGFIGNFGYLAVCVVGALLVQKDIISFGVIVAFIIYVRLFTNPLSQIAQSMTSLQSTAAASERVFEFLESEEMSNQKDIHDKLKVSDAKGNVEIKNVKFGYDENKTIIKNFSVNVSSGQKIAIVGPTGAGKTTIVNLLMKFYEINNGDILIDGKSIHDLTRENIHDLFTMVLQDTWLFEGSVRDNIKFNRKNISDEEIWNALKVVGVDHFVKTLPGGLDATIDDGDSISQGQKQLLTIARGMIENSSLLILDEATSNVDTRTEELVQKAMDKLTKGKTSFIIAHRLSTIKNADIILVMKNGDIVEQGTHDELMNKNGFYADLYNSQFTTNN